MNLNPKIKIMFVVAVAIMIVGIIVIAYSDHNKWEDGCVAQGGHVVHHTVWGTKASNSQTTYYCLNKDGGIIDIEN